MPPVKGLQIRANDQIVISIYKNICEEFINYRKLNLDDPIMDNKTFSEEVFKKGYVSIKSSINSKWKKNTYIILYHFITSDILKAADVKKIISKITKDNLDTEGEKTPFDIIIITQNPVSTHVSNYIREFQSKYKELNENNSTASDVECLFDHEKIHCNCWKNNIYCYTYTNFIITVPKHVLVPEYKVLNGEERTEVISTLFTRKAKLPKIKRNDPCVIWSHAIAGDIIEFDRNDEVTGKSIYYRIVV